jgi:S1-C subfamily serine protease
MLPPPLPPKEISTTNESDLIAKAVETNLSKMVTIHEGETMRGIGFSASGDALVVTDKNILGKSAEYSAVFSDGKSYKAVNVYTDKDSDIAILQLRDEKDQVATSTPYISFASNEPKLGASVIALGGKEGATVYQGIVSEKTKSRIIISISFKPIDSGGILFGMDSKVFGINVATGEEKYTLPSAAILSALETYRKEGTPKAL